MTFEIIGVRDGEETRKEFPSRSEAEGKADDLADLFDEIKVRQVQGSDEPTTGPGTRCKECGGDIPADAPDKAELCEHHGAWALATSDGGETTVKSESVADKMEAPPEATQADVSESVDKTVDTTQNGDATHQTPRTGETHDLPDKPPVDTDPLTWMPSEFTDKIDGTIAINRKGFSVLKQHFDIGVDSDCVVGPEENGFTFCRHKAVATMPDGTRSEAHGSAHVDRGDDPWLLLEMSDTRAKKRALSDATGIGMVAVSELQNKP